MIAGKKGGRSSHGSVHPRKPRLLKAPYARKQRPDRAGEDRAKEGDRHGHPAPSHLPRLSAPRSGGKEDTEAGQDASISEETVERKVMLQGTVTANSPPRRC